jgi:hypothetical protein
MLEHLRDLGFLEKVEPDRIGLKLLKTCVMGSLEGAGRNQDMDSKGRVAGAFSRSEPMHKLKQEAHPVRLLVHNRAYSVELVEEQSDRSFGG